MSFSDAVKSVFSKYAEFSGRARRSEYWYFTLFSCLVSTAFAVLIRAAGGADSTFGTILSGLQGIWSLGILVPGLALCWRRLHDIGRSGASWFLIFIPLVGAILLLVWFCQDSQPGDNMYGSNPKENTKYYN